MVPHFSRFNGMISTQRVFEMALRTSVAFGVYMLAAARVSAQARDADTLGTVIISASKTPISRSELSQAVTVITGEDLRARGVARVNDALQLVPGATIAQNGSTGSVSSLFLRGGESRYTKILIDGVAVNQSGGFFDFSHLTTDNIERIEIVRGPASVLYGADAVTGVIQIFTRQGRGPLSLNASARGGTFGTLDADLGLSGAAKKVGYSIAGAQHRTDGILDFNNQYSNGTLSGAISLLPGSANDLRVAARSTNAEFHYPTDYTGAPVDSNSYRVQHRLTVGLDAGQQITSTVRIGFLTGTNEVSDLTEDIAVPFDSSTPSHRADLSHGYRRTAEGRLTFALPTRATLNLGGEYLREQEHSNSSSGPVGGEATIDSRLAAYRTNRAGYAELVGTALNRLSYTLAGRIDDNSDFDSHATYRVGTSVALTSSMRARGFLGTAYNAPAFNQLRPTLYTAGSPGLSPERARSWEVGAEQTVRSGLARVSGSYFNQRFIDLIQYVAGGPPELKGSYANLAEAQSNGYEMEADVTPPGVMSASASFTYARPRVARVAPGYSGSLAPGEALIRRPTHSGAATIRLTPRRGSLALTANYVGKRPDIDFNLFPSPTVTLPAYTRIDLSGLIDVWTRPNGSSLSVTGRVENALDRQYETVLHYPAPGRTILVGARYSGSL
jgi:vitamin B12 transporter